MPEPEDLPFTVEIWSADEVSLERVLARCARVDIAKGAAGAVAGTFSAKTILVRDGARVVARIRPTA
jgi:endonuclease YncB( thermonuclease family)